MRLLINGLISSAGAKFVHKCDSPTYMEALLSYNLREMSLVVDKYALTPSLRL